MRNLHTVFNNDCTNLHFHQHCMSLHFYSHSGQNLFVVVYFIIATVIGMGWYLIVVVICIFLMISDVEHLFMCLLAICNSSLEKCLFSSSVHFKSDFFLVCFLILSFMSSLCILEIDSLLDISIANTFSH